jgi:predicted MPP superfamily phosphohydrolase
MVQKRDFRHVTHFPGTHGNTLDRILHVMDDLERLPAGVFVGLLLLLSLPAAWASWNAAGLLWLFMLGDWALLAGLPRRRVSFGPAKANVLILGLMRLPFAFLPEALVLIVQLIGTGLVAYGFWVEPRRLTVTHQRLTSAKLDPTHPPLRILHLGDLHVERFTQRERDVIALTRQLAPDLVLFSGDFLNLSYLEDPVAQADCRTILTELGQLPIPLGILAVTGSPAVDKDEIVPGLLAGLPLRWLRGERVTLSHKGHTFDVLGLACSHKPFEDAPQVAALLDDTLRERLTILLYHSPDLAPDAAELGIDLQLSGHTHAGQIRLPGFGPLMTGSLYGRALESGRKQLGRLTLYVTRGIGLEGKGAPRMRLFCPPEVILWDIQGLERKPAGT